MPTSVIPQKSAETKRAVEEECVCVAVNVPASPQRTKVLENAMIQKGHLGNNARRRPAKKPDCLLARGKAYLLDFAQCFFSNGITNRIERDLQLKLHKLSGKKIFSFNVDQSLSCHQIQKFHCYQKSL
jgi:hypothetical protein